MPDYIANRYGHYKHGDLDTYAALARLAAKEDRPLYPHIETIAKIARRSIRTVKRAIKKFQADLVLIVNKTGRASNYVLVPLLPTGFPDPESGEYIIAKAMVGCRQIPKSGDYLYAGNADYEVSKVPVRDAELSPQECPHVTSEVPKSHCAYNKETHTLNTTTTTPPPPKLPPEPEPPPPPEMPPQSSVVVSSLRSKIAPEKQSLISNKTITSALETFTEKQVEILIAQVNDPKKDIINPGGYIAKACKEKWDIPQEQAVSIELTPQQQLEKNIAENKKNDQRQDNLEADGRASLEEIRALRAKNYKTKSINPKIDKFADNLEVGLNEDKVAAAKALAQMIIAGKGHFGNDI